MAEIKTLLDDVIETELANLRTLPSGNEALPCATQGKGEKQAKAEQSHLRTCKHSG